MEIDRVEARKGGEEIVCLLRAMEHQNYFVHRTFLQTARGDPPN
jgi:hypothetical protein